MAGGRLQPPSQWRDLHLLWLPGVLVCIPLLRGLGSVGLGAMVFYVVGYAITGLMEEGFHRGVILKVLRPTGPTRAVLISAALFGAAHLSNVFFRDSAVLVVAQAVGAACFGVGYAALRLRLNTLWPLVVLHALTDLFACIGALPAIPILVAQDVILLGYGLYLLRGMRAEAVTPAPAGASGAVRSRREKAHR